MAFDPLPSPSSLAGAILTIENQLSALDRKLAGITFTAKSTDQKVTIGVDAAIEVTSITIDVSLLTGSSVNLTTLASTIVTVTNQALASAHTRAASEAATASAAFNLMGICVPN